MDSHVKASDSVNVAIASGKCVVAFGLDVSKATFECAMARSDQAPFEPADLRRIKTRTFDRTAEQAAAFLDWAESQMPDDSLMIVVMESTGSYSMQLACWLLATKADLSLAIVDPKRPKSYAVTIGVRNKTDKIDARVISAYAAERRPVSDQPVEQIYRDLRAMTRTRQFLLAQLTAMRSHLEMLVTEQLSLSVGKHVTKALNQAITKFEKQIEVIEKQLKEMVNKADERLRRDIQMLDSLVGVAFLTAVTICAEFGDLRRFGSARQLVAMAGLNPEIKQSGKRIGQSHISKRGSSFARCALYMSALSAITADCDFHEFYDHLVEQSHKKKMVATVAVMRKMLVTMRAVVITGHPYQRHYRSCGKVAPSPCGKPPNAS